jgi:hypothetical protein
LPELFWINDTRLAIRCQSIGALPAPKKVQNSAVAYDYLDGNRPKSLKAGQLAWMYFQQKNQLRFTPDGFELLLKENGKLMSRYHWL